MFGRLKDGATVESAQAELNSLLDRQTASSPAERQSGPTCRPYVDSLLSDARDSGQALILF